MSAADLARLDLLSDLAPKELELLAEVVEVQTLGLGEVLCLEGSEADGALLLVDGVLDCHRDDTGDLGRIEAPAALGLAALAKTANREATLRAASPARVLLLTRNGFHRFSQDAPSAAVRMLEAVVRDLAAVLHGSASALLPPRG